MESFGRGAITKGRLPYCCKTVADREGIEGLKGNSGNRETTINPLIFKSKPESQTEIKGL
jgi:hypothetical protein